MVNSLNVISGMTAAELESLVESLGEPGYRGKQLQHWIYRGLAFSFDEMTDLPAAFRQRLAAETRLYSLRPAYEASGQDGTVKVLFKLTDGLTIESALMSYREEGSERRNTVCVSTQAGCAIGCPFCATGQQGFRRNLTPGEIIDQVLYFARHLQKKARKDGKNTSEKTSSRPTNIVFMGMGEPLANYSALLDAIELLNAPEGFGLGARSMVVSTAGLVPQIGRLSREKYQVGLAVSLHASDNKLRDRLVPVNRKYPLEQLIPACREYCRATGRRLSFEYVLLHNINDSTAQAQALAGLLRGLNCHVNLIPANDTGDRSFRAPSRGVVMAFERELRQCGINATLRQPRGQDINAGCGQLRSRSGEGRGKGSRIPATGE
jgi:23S rRNA (adenine2503-C2)-methyltransferase